MSKKLFSIDVRGRHKEWSFLFWGDAKHLDEWRADGLRVNEVINVVPEVVVNLGLARLWCFLQDIGIVPI